MRLHMPFTHMTALSALAARLLKSEGSFAGLASLVPYAEVNGFFSGAPREEPMDEACGRSESLDPDNVGDIADEGMGHRG